MQLWASSSFFFFFFLGKDLRCGVSLGPAFDFTEPTSSGPDPRLSPNTAEHVALLFASPGEPTEAIWDKTGLSCRCLALMMRSRR